MNRIATLLLIGFISVQPMIYTVQPDNQEAVKLQDNAEYKKDFQALIKAIEKRGERERKNQASMVSLLNEKKQ